MLTVDYDRFGLHPGDLLLDLGCGFGRHTYEALVRGADVVSCDMALPELEAIRTTAPMLVDDGTFDGSLLHAQVQGDGTRLPFPDETFVATVSFVSPTIDARTRTLRVKAQVENSDGRLRPGLFARVDLGVAEREDVAMIPEEAILRRADGAVVFRAVGDRVERLVIEPGVHHRGYVEVVRGLSPGDLIVSVDGDPVVAIVPVDRSLRLKALAAALGGKRAAMADPGDAERLTGYVTGGISPFGQRKRLPVVLDASALEWEAICVSGGRRGLQVEVAPGDLVSDLGAAAAPISG